MDATDLVKLLVAPDRLAVAGALAVRARTTEELATDTGIDQRTVVETVGRLVQAGLAVQDGDRYRLDPDAWRALAQTITDAPREPDRWIGFGMTAEERDVLARYFAGTRLTRLPASRNRRLVILERLALEFEPGRRYPETHVNDILATFHDDVATLRRALVDEGLLDRAAGQYWRAGGRLTPAR